jgi:UDPglucose 6-dehydrogenase
MENAKKEPDLEIGYAANMYAAAEGADAIAILTEWDEFRELDLSKVVSVMRGRAIVDFRGVIDKAAALSGGFKYTGV